MNFNWRRCSSWIFLHNCLICYILLRECVWIQENEPYRKCLFKECHSLTGLSTVRRDDVQSPASLSLSEYCFHYIYSLCLQTSKNKMPWNFPGELLVFCVRDVFSCVTRYLYPSLNIYITIIIYGSFSNWNNEFWSVFINFWGGIWRGKNSSPAVPRKMGECVGTATGKSLAADPFSVLFDELNNGGQAADGKSVSRPMAEQARWRELHLPRMWCHAGRRNPKWHLL